LRRRPFPGDWARSIITIKVAVPPPVEIYTIGAETIAVIKLDKMGGGPGLLATGPAAINLSPRSEAPAADDEDMEATPSQRAAASAALALSGAAAAPSASSLSIAPTALTYAQMMKGRAAPLPPVQQQPHGLESILATMQQQMNEMKARQDHLEHQHVETATKLDSKMDNNHAQLVAMLQQLAGAAAAAAAGSSPTSS
jgi:hypothetical protein